MVSFAYLVFNAIEIYQYSKVDERRKCDVAIILGASTDNSGVSPVYAERINHGVTLYHNNDVEYLILTGGVGEGNDFSDAFRAKEYALSKGVPEAAILLEENSQITLENLENSKTIMGKHHLKTCMIVSDPLHMKRAMLMAKDCGLDAYSSPTPTTRYRSWKTKLPFLFREEFFYLGYRLYRLLS